MNLFSSSRPVVAFDVDGVLNRLTHRDQNVVLEETADESSAWVSRQVVMKDTFSPKHRFIGPTYGQDLTFKVTLNTALHGPWLKALAHRADLVWATTWEEAANILLGPLYGLPNLPLGVASVLSDTRYDEYVWDWKARCLETAFPDRPLIWVDDTPGPYAQVSMLGLEKRHPREFYWGRDLGHYALKIDPEQGLLKQDMAFIDSLVSEFSALS